MKRVDNLRSAVFMTENDYYFAALKWEGPDKWGLRGEEKPTVEQAVTSVVEQFYCWLRDENKENQT